MDGLPGSRRIDTRSPRLLALVCSDFDGETIHAISPCEGVGAKLQQTLEWVADQIAIIFPAQVGHEVTDSAQPHPHDSRSSDIIQAKRLSTLGGKS